MEFRELSTKFKSCDICGALFVYHPGFNLFDYFGLCSMHQEEEDLVNAHRKLVEETMDIVREVCNGLYWLVIIY